MSTDLVQARGAGQRANGDVVLSTSVAELQATAYNFASACIHESRVRAQYVRDIQAMSREYLEAVGSGRLAARDAAAQVNVLRNQILDLARLRSSPVGRAFASKLKPTGRSMLELTEKYAQRIFQRGFGALTEAEQASVFAEIVASAGRGDPRVIALARSLGKAGKRILLVSLAVACYEVYAAEDRPRELARQGMLAGVGVAGGWVAGSAAVAAGVCAATAPVCVGVAAIAGGLVFAFGADMAFDSLLPKPARL